MQHIPQIKLGLQIAVVSLCESTLIVLGVGNSEGMQIDLQIDCADDGMKVCEMKFYKLRVSVTQSYADNIAKRISRLEAEVPSKTFHPTLIIYKSLLPGLCSDIL